ncbi:MAG: 23S rRNA pseudouridine(1911/1915/1917) synthase RluD [Gammaproteobacteria bacterium]
MISLIITDEYAALRLDQAVAKMCPQFSRSRLQDWIKSGCVLVDGVPARQRDITKSGQVVNINAVPEIHNEDWLAEDIPLHIIHEDEHIIVLDKPAGIVVHPGAGNPNATLVNALLFHCTELQHIPRAGIVQRLDKDTSGIMIVAKSPAAHTQLVRDLQEHRVKREYRALVHGELTSGGTVDKAIGRHPSQRTKMAVTEGGKPAITHYRLLGRYNGITELRVTLETGRTHQIRVHLAYIKHPVIGDPVYSGRNRLPKNISPALRDSLQGFRRQALHAEALTLQHPLTSATMHWQAPPPADYLELLQQIQSNTA